MVRSIQVYRYEDSYSEEDILGIIKKIRSVENIVFDKNNKSHEIDIPSTISEVKSNDYGVGGHFFYRYQEKINKHMENEKYGIFGENYDFLLSPKAGIIIVHGTGKFRPQVRNLLSKVIHNELRGFFTEIIIHRDAMYELVDEIRKDDQKNNNVAKPSFEFLERKYNDFTELDFATGETLCVTNHKDFSKYYDACTLWSPKMKIKHCTGILESPPDDRALLSMNYNASFTLSQDASPMKWNQFVFMKCKKALGLR